MQLLDITSLHICISEWQNKQKVDLKLNNIFKVTLIEYKKIHNFHRSVKEITSKALFLELNISSYKNVLAHTLK